MYLLCEWSLWVHLTVGSHLVITWPFAIRMNVIWHEGSISCVSVSVYSSEIIVGSDNFIQHNNAVSLKFETNYNIREVNVVMF